MPIDPSIPLSVRPFQGADPFRALDYALRVRQQKRLEQQLDIQTQREAEQAKREQEAGQVHEALGKAYQEAATVSPEGEVTLDRQKLLTSIPPQLWGSVSAELDKADTAALNRRKTQAELAKLQREDENQKAEFVSRLAYGVDQAGNTPEGWNWLVSQAKANQAVTDEELAPFQQVVSQDPSQIASFTKLLMGKSASAKPKASETVKTREMKYFNPETQQEEVGIFEDKPGLTLPVAPKGVTTEKGPKLGSAEDFMLRFAKDKNKTPDELTTAEVSEGLRKFNALNDRPAAAASGGGGQGSSDVREAVKAMKEGTVPPQLPGRASKDYTAILAEARRQGFDLARAAEDWTATSRYLNTLNGAQQVRLRQAVTFTKDSLPIVEELANQWDAGKFPILNRANLKLAKNGAMGAKAQSIATRLDAQINDLTSELGTVYKGGNSSTDESLKLAAENLRSDWSKATMLDNIKQIRRNLEIRDHSIHLGSPAGTSENNPYAPTQAAPVERWERGPDGKLRKAK